MKSRHEGLRYIREPYGRRVVLWEDFSTLTRKVDTTRVRAPSPNRKVRTLN